MKKIAFGFTASLVVIMSTAGCKPNGNNNSTDAENSLGERLDTVNVNRMDTSNILPIGPDSSKK
jgi:hypothetical protein